jgi:hypothetical protein
LKDAEASFKREMTTTFIHAPGGGTSISPLTFKPLARPCEHLGMPLTDKKAAHAVLAGLIHDIISAIDMIASEEATWKDLDAARSSHDLSHAVHHPRHQHRTRYGTKDHKWLLGRTLLFEEDELSREVS